MKLKSIIPLVFLINLFSGCWHDAVQDKPKDNSASKASLEDWQNIVVISEMGWLAVNEKCIWCWKCAFVAPGNFSMNTQTFKADVISWENLESESVKKAKDICPTDAIVIS
jgi:ferredoxin